MQNIEIKLFTHSFWGRAGFRWVLSSCGSPWPASGPCWPRRKPDPPRGSTWSRCCRCRWRAGRPAGSGSRWPARPLCLNINKLTSQSLACRLLQCVDFYERKFLGFEFLHDVVEGVLIYLKLAGSKGLEQDRFSQDLRAIKHSTSSWNNLSTSTMNCIWNKLTINHSVFNSGDIFLTKYTLFCYPIECSLCAIFNLWYICVWYTIETKPIN